MELMQGAQNKRQQQNIMDYLNEFDFTVLPITENISHRAQIYSEEYALLNFIRAGDAWIAATAMENNLTLANANAKHLRCIPNLKFKLFKPQVK
jgi:predicted nucleic acid-binding protein